MSRSPSSWLITGVVAMALGLAAGDLARADDSDDNHAHHHAVPTQSAAQRTTAEYTIPDVDLVREDGKVVHARAEFDDGRPVLLGFIFTTCAAICPITSATFRQFQDKLGPNEPVHIASISIDPEQDTPSRLRQYARKFGAGANWQHYTGAVAASVAMQRAFEAYRGDKMDHAAVAFLRAAPGKPWVRIDGFAAADQLIAEYRAITAPSALASR
ncbi:MAG: SCO1/SenC [Gammaproteobacteria bacterium]|nr:SCO1/SenC [Gammaproteobacteria bacterium]